MLLLACATGLGLSIAAALRLPLGGFARVGVGVAVGQLLVMWLPFSLALALDLGAAAAGLGASGLLVLSWLAWGLARRHDPAPIAAWAAQLRAGLAAREQRPARLTGLALLGLLGWLHHTHYLVPRSDGLHSAGVTWGDLPIHLSLATRFLHADGLAQLEHPLYLGGPLGYPFLPDYAAAVLCAQGLSLRAALIVGGLVPLVGVCLLLHGLVQLWLGDEVRPRPTALALALFFLAGGLGAGVVVARLLEGAPLLPLLASTNATYLDPHVLKSGHVGNLFLAARTASFGMSLGLAALLVLGHVVQAAAPPRGAFVLSGVLVGALPLVHGHSFAVLFGVTLFYVLLGRRHRLRWLACLAPLALLALPQLLWLGQAGARGNLRLVSGFLRPAPSAGEWLLDVVLGVGLPLIVVPLALRAARVEARWLAAPLLLLLPVANLVTITPSFYDNVKLLAWFDVGASVLMAGMLAAWLRRKADGRRNRARVAAAVLALLGCTASGALAIGHELTNDALVVSHADVRLAELVTEHTRADAIVATGASYHDPVALLSGRRVVLSTPRMVGTHGIDPRARALDLVRLYAGGPAAREVIDRLGVTAVVVGSRERADLPRIDEAFLAAQAERVLERDGQRLYLLRR